ncbi:hypothetical protein HYU10_02405 [Candidatus Woesearchaeota archaeon]|nr:hypothetical protein [Candidatus Woesearchaeota archaeon]MBI2130599.1 hypothetical protein [Candidatus Woesearchaeota archaeon]
MQFIPYFLLSVAAFLSFIAGAVIIRLAPEEQKPLQKYLILGKRAALALMFLFLIFFYVLDMTVLLLAASLLVAAVFFELKTREGTRKAAEIYAMLGIVFFLSIPNANLLAINTSLIFAYGMMTSSIIFDRDYIRAAMPGLSFLIIANLLFAVNYHFSSLI